ncbi:hypothetical protein D3C76_1108070 [compost metagenome]
MGKLASFFIQQMEPRQMIEPPSCWRMSGITAWVAKTWWRRFTARLRSKVVSSMSLRAWRMSLAALLTSTVIAPIRSRAVSIAVRSAGRSVRSQCR